MEDFKIFKDIEYTAEIIKNLNPLSLAFIGDGVHTLYVRSKVLSLADLKLNNYHLKSTKHCSAVAQARFLDEITPSLTDEEKDIIRRARNTKLHHTAKNAGEEIYKKATSFEALIGYLYLNKKYDRLIQILEMEKY